MNMSAQTMRWSDIDINEGSKIQTLSSSDVEEVSGGIPPAVYYGALAGFVIVSFIAYSLGYNANID